MTFQELGLIEPLLRAIAAEGYSTPTSIQLQAVPVVMSGRDLLGCAQTGTGKTAAFALPILQRLAGHQPQRPRNGFNGQGRKKQHQPRRAIRTLVVAPTRELASQIAESFRTYGRHLPLRSVAIFGGVGQFPQVKALRDGVDVLIATPGRLLDLMNQGHVDLNQVETLVLDEADQMLDMGFLPDIRRVISRVPAKRQTLLFSATMPADIRVLADSILRTPEEIHINPHAKAAENIDQSVFFVQRKNKPAVLHHLLLGRCMGRTLVFTRTKHGADRVVKALTREGIDAAAIHGNKSQNVRTRTLARFKATNPPVLVATDIASRGIDVDNVMHVINFDLPSTPEAYVHRIGRTARAGASGSAVSLCDRDEQVMLRSIERLTGIRMTIMHQKDMPDAQHMIEAAPIERGDRSEQQRPVRTKRPGQSQSARSGRGRQPKSPPRDTGRDSSARGHRSSSRDSNDASPKRMKRSQYRGKRALVHSANNRKSRSQQR